MKSSIFWDVTQCSPLKFNHVSDVRHLHLQGRRISHVRNQHEAGSKLTGQLFGLFFDPEDGGDMFLRNVS
jgi:hypothetical protein